MTMGGPPPAHVDPGDAGRTPDGAAACFEPADQRGRQLSGATLGHRPPVLLTETGEHPGEEAARGDVGPDIGVHGVAGQQERGALPGELLAGEATDREQRLAGEIEEPPRSERGRQAHRPLHRRHRRHHRREQGIAHALEVGVERTPRATVARGERLE